MGHDPGCRLASASPRRSSFRPDVSRRACNGESTSTPSHGSSCGCFSRRCRQRFSHGRRSRSRPPWTQTCTPSALQTGRPVTRAITTTQETESYTPYTPYTTDTQDTHTHPFRPHAHHRPHTPPLQHQLRSTRSTPTRSTGTFHPRLPSLSSGTSKHTAELVRCSRRTTPICHRR